MKDSSSLRGTISRAHWRRDGLRLPSPLWRSAGPVRGHAPERRACPGATGRMGLVQGSSHLSVPGRLPLGEEVADPGVLGRVQHSLDLLGSKVGADVRDLGQHLLERPRPDHRGLGRVLNSVVSALAADIAPQLQAIDLNGMIMNVDKMLRRIVGERIELVFLPKRCLGPINVDSTQMEQVLINLVVNARDAMPGGGRIVIETDHTVLGDEVLNRLADSTPPI